MLTEGCLTRQIPQLHNGAMLAESQHNGGWVGGGAHDRLVTPGEGRTLSTLAGDDPRMNAGFEETPRPRRNPSCCPEPAAPEMEGKMAADTCPKTRSTVTVCATLR